MLDVALQPSKELTIANGDYKMVRNVIEAISNNWRDHPSLDELSNSVGYSPTQMQKTFTRWAGLSPKAFLQAVTLDHAKKLLAQDLPLLETSLELGLSGPGRLHDLFVTHEAMSPGIYRAKGEGLEITYGFHDCQFGKSLIMATAEGMAGMAFCDVGEEVETLADMKSRWPRANYREDSSITAPYAARSFNPDHWREDQPLKVVLIGTDFEVRVWQGLLKIPLGKATTYSSVANDIGRPKAPRAVGRAVRKKSYFLCCTLPQGSW